MISLVEQKILDLLNADSDSGKAQDRLISMGFSEDEIDEAWMNLSMSGRIREKLKKSFAINEPMLVGQIGHWEVVG